MADGFDHGEPGPNFRSSTATSFLRRVARGNRRRRRPVDRYRGRARGLRLCGGASPALPVVGAKREGEAGVAFEQVFDSFSFGSERPSPVEPIHRAVEAAVSLVEIRRHRVRVVEIGEARGRMAGAGVQDFLRQRFESRKRRRRAGPEEGQNRRVPLRPRRKTGAVSP